MWRVVHKWNKKRSDNHGVLQAWSIVFVVMLLNQQKRPPRKYCYQSSEITAYRNKISLKLGYRTVNARKYVRCARTFYLFLKILIRCRDTRDQIYPTSARKIFGVAGKRREPAEKYSCNEFNYTFSKKYIIKSKRLRLNMC